MSKTLLCLGALFCISWIMVEHELDNYRNLCTQVYDLSKPNPPADAFAFYRSYASDADGPILEPMCGTGRFLLPLLEEGFAMQGFDASRHMLEALHAKAARLSLKPVVWQGFLEDLKLLDQYSLILIPAGSFGLISDLDTVRSALETLHDRLRDDGTLVFEIETLSSAPSQTGIWRGSVWPRDDGKFIIANYLELPVQDNVGTTIWTYELIEDSNCIHTEFETLKLRYHDAGKLKLLLHDVGFHSVRMVTAFDRSRCASEDDPLIVLECQK